MKRSTSAAAWVLLVVAAVVLWPKSWGGTMTYVLTSGTSMQPAFRAGDLAVLRSADDYRPGDVVAFRSERLGKVVMHRVLREDDGVYVFQGDNNDFVDPDQVREEQMLGRVALRVPRVGPVLEWLVQPVNLLLAVGGLALLVSDRRRTGVPVPEPLVLQVQGFRVPAGAAVVDVVDEADLQRLSVRYDRPVLRDEATGESWLDDGRTVYRHAPAAADAGVVVPLPRSRRKPPAQDEDEPRSVSSR